MYHTRKTRSQYRRHIRVDGQCPFCMDETAARTVQETAHAYVLPNITYYDMWELREVEEHLMIIPKRHVHGLDELNDAEKLDIMKLIADYEAKGYNIYARSVDSQTRSVIHQHTHLIKVKKKPAKLLLFAQKPYFMWRW